MKTEQLHREKSYISQAGFTLVEILISLTILAIIMVIILQAFQLSNKAWQVGEKRIDEFQRTRIIMDQMNREIRGAYPFKSFQNSEDFPMEDCKGNIEFVGKSDSLSFVTAEKSFSTPDFNFGFRAVTYYVDNDSGTEEEGLVMMENIPWGLDPFGEGNIIEIDSSVVDIKFEYYICIDENLDNTIDDDECNWIDSWDPCEESDVGEKIEETKQIKSTIPKAVKITMTVNREKKLAGGFEQSEEVVLPSIVVPIYCNVVPGVNSLGVSNSSGSSLTDLLSGTSGSTGTKQGDAALPGTGSKESSRTPEQNNPQKAEEMLRQLLSGELNQGKK
jgi:general secretion pathway protein J